MMARIAIDESSESHWDNTSSARPVFQTTRRHLNLKQDRTEKFEMLLQKRALRVQSARYSKQTEIELDTAVTSQQYFKLEVPKWSNYYTPATVEKKTSSPVTLNTHRRDVHEVKWCLVPAPVIVSDRSSPLIDIPVVRTLVMGDSTLKQVELETPGATVNCIQGARVSDIKGKLEILANAGRRFHRIIIQFGIHEVQLRQSELTKKKIQEVFDLAKTMSDTVICSGPLPSYWGDEIYSRLSDLHDWLCKWCPQNNVGFIDNWLYFCGRPDLFGQDGFYPNRNGTAVLSKSLTESLKSSSV